MAVLLGKDVENLQEGIKKVQPAGIDVVPKAIFRIPKEKIEYAVFDGKRRGYIINGKFVPLQEALEKIEPKDGFWELDEGIYYVVFPKIKIPKDCIAIAYPRSTLNRLGMIKCQSAVFDPGYEGEYNQAWYFPIKAKINVNEAWIQIVFIKLVRESEEVYKGHWRGETYK